MIADIPLFNHAPCGQLSQLDENGSWTPSKQDIDGLESVLIARLVPELARFAEEYDVRAKPPDVYVRRYAGAEVQGRRVIAICGEVRAMYNGDHADWRRTPILLRDGGDDTFGALYDPATHQITYFEFGYMA